MIGCKKPQHSNKSFSKIAQLLKLTLNKRTQGERVQQIVQVITFVFHYGIILHICMLYVAILDINKTSFQV